MKCLPTTSALLLLVTLAPACGGGGGGDGDAALTATATLASPSTSGATDASTLDVRGTTTPGARATADVRVNGKPVTSGNGFADWVVSLPVASGSNDYTIEIEDDEGTVTTVRPDVEVTGAPPILVQPQTAVFDPKSNVLLVADFQRKELLALNVVDGSRKVVASVDEGSGPMFESAPGMALDVDAQILWVLDPILDVVLEVDLASGVRTIVAQSGPGEPVQISGSSLTLDLATGTLYYANATEGLVSCDPATGTLTAISKSEPGLGPFLFSPRGVAFDPETGRVLVVDSDEIFTIDPATGEREVLSPEDPAVPVGFLGDCGLDPVHGLVVVDGLDVLFAIDPKSGERRELSGGALGDGPPFDDLVDVTTESGVGYAVDRGSDLVWVVDLATGDRTPVGATKVGEGPPLFNQLTMKVAESGLVFTSNGSGSTAEILAIDPKTGDRATVTGNGVGSGEPLGFVSDLDVRPGTNELVVTSSGGRVLTVEPITGARTLALDLDAFGSPQAVWLPGPARELLVLDGEGRLVRADLDANELEEIATGINAREDLAFDPVTARALAIDSNRILAIDIATGQDTTLTEDDDSAGGGEPFQLLDQIDVDPVARLAYVRDISLEAVLTVHLDTGFRELVASPSVGVGLAWDGEGGLALSRDSRTVFVFDPETDSLLGIATATGDRVVVAR